MEGLLSKAISLSRLEHVTDEMYFQSSTQVVLSLGTQIPGQSARLHCSYLQYHLISGCRYQTCLESG